MTFRSTASLVLLATVALAGCSKPPLVGTFAGTATVRTTHGHTGDPETKVDAPSTVTIATDGSSGDVKYVVTFEGAPFSGKCTLSDGLAADSKNEQQMLVFGKTDCKVTGADGVLVGDTMGTLRGISKDEVDVNLQWDAALASVTYTVKAKRSK